MSEKEPGTIGPARWMLVAVAVTLTLVTAVLVARAVLGGPSPSAEPSPPAATEATGARGNTGPAMTDEPLDDGSETAPAGMPGAVAPPGGSSTPAPPTAGSGAPSGVVTPKAASDVVSKLLSAVHDGDVAAGQRLVTNDFLAVVGGAEWLGAGPDALRVWKITGARAEDGFVWVSVTETWDYGVQNAQYMVIERDGSILVDAAEWGL